MEASQEDIAKIPHGPYCYTGVGETYKPCPFYSYQDINGVSVPYCEFLKKGGTPNPQSEQTADDYYEKLIDHFGSIEKVWEGLPLDLLFDQCKECSHNDDYPVEP